jgi:hypothetical protein
MDLKALWADEAQEWVCSTLLCVIPPGVTFWDFLHDGQKLLSLLDILSPHVADGGGRRPSVTRGPFGCAASTFAARYACVCVCVCVSVCMCACVCVCECVSV